MKNILLIGKENTSTQELGSVLGEFFEVTTDFGDAGLIDGLLRISIPDLVIINLDGVHLECRDICRLLAESFSKIPVILIGNQAICLSYSSFLHQEQFSQLNISVIDNTVVRACCRIMKISYAETLNAKKSGFESNSKQTILLVDDSALQNRISKNILDAKYNVKVTMSANQALEVIAQGKPDLIVLDYDMPDFDGYHFLRVLREEPATADIPVIFLTGVVDKEHVSKVIPLKPDGYLLKPVSAEKLLARVKSLLEG